jgi:hypothetical protein
LKETSASFSAVRFWISGGTSWMLKPPPVTYLDRWDEKFPVNFTCGGRVRGNRRSDQINFWRWHELWRWIWPWVEYMKRTAHDGPCASRSNSLPPWRRVIVGSLEGYLSNLGMRIQNSDTPMTSSCYTHH